MAPLYELLKPWLRNAHINELWKTDYPWRELFSLMKQAGLVDPRYVTLPSDPDGKGPGLFACTAFAPQTPPSKGAAKPTT